MYKPGTLRRLTPLCEEALMIDPDDGGPGCCGQEGHYHSAYDSNGGGKCEIPCVMLGHSCGEWVIGGREQVKALIADLQAALAEMEG